MAGDGARRDVTWITMDESRELDRHEQDALDLLGRVDGNDGEALSRDQMLARAQVHATLAVASALRAVAEATRQAGHETARAIPSGDQIPEKLGEIGQHISQLRWTAS